MSRVGGGEAPNDKSRTVVIFGLKRKCDSGEGGGGVWFDLIKPNPPPPPKQNVCSQLILNKHRQTSLDTNYQPDVPQLVLVMKLFQLMFPININAPN